MLCRIRSICLNAMSLVASAVLLTTALTLPVFAGTTVEYHYDAVGNIISIERSGTALAINGFSPESGPVGTEITIYGNLFSVAAEQNTVSFNGITAPILSASESMLVVRVPLNATSGLISVTVQGNTVYSEKAFVVTDEGGNGPVLSAQSIASITSAGATVRATSNSVATAYWIVRLASEPAPATAAEIVAGAGNSTGAMKANTAFSKAFSGLDPGTDYKLYFVAGNNAGYSAVWSAAFSTTAVTPTLSARAVSNITNTSMTFTATSSVVATGYWVVRPASTAVPTAAQIVAAADRGSGAMPAKTAFTRTVTGLTPGTAYRLHFVAQNGNRYSTVWSQAFTTEIAPVLSAQSIASITSAGATVRATSNSVATAYWIVRLASEPAPATAAEIVAGAGNSTGAMKANTAFSKAFSGLDPGTDYKLYFVAGNNAGYSAVWSAAFTTTAVTPALSARAVSNITNTSVTFTATSSVVATGYWVVRPASAAVPTAAQIVAAADRGSGAMPARTAFTRTVTGLTPGTAYRLHFVAQNGNRYSTVWSQAFTTDIAPVLSAQSIASITSAGATVRATSNSVATAYWIVRLASEPAPATAAEIVAGAGNNTGAMKANTAFSKAFSGLDPGTDYKLYFVAGNNAGYSAVWSAAFTTTAVTPTLSARAVSNITNTSVTFTATSSVVATGHWVVRPASTAVPTAAQIVAAADRSSGAMPAKTAFTRTVTGLTPGTAYRLHFVAQNGNRYSTVWSQAFTTAR